MITVRKIAMAAVSIAAAWGAWAAWLQPPAPEATGQAIAIVTVPALSSSAEEGEGLFEANCASCHGESAAGRHGIGPPLVHRIYEPSHHGDAAFLIAVLNGVRQHHWQFGNMPPVQGVSESEVSAIVEYVRALQRENGIR